jgi:hypothetical protein
MHLLVRDGGEEGSAHCSGRFEQLAPRYPDFAVIHLSAMTQRGIYFPRLMFQEQLLG